jgi:two-component system response regulator LytT
MNVIIVEDEQLAANNLECLLMAVDPSIVVLAKLESVRATVKWLTQNKCDLLFSIKFK